MKTVLTALVSAGIVSLLGAQASAAIPSWCKTDEEGVCPVSARPGRQPCGTEMGRMLDRGARNRLGSAGPDMPKIGQGQPSMSVTATAPCPLVKAIAHVETVWTQFCADGCDNGGKTLISFDCGYGIMQVTSGMRGGYNFVPERVATDPRYNVGAGMLILFDKWKITPAVGDNQPQAMEHWYMATWAYNGFGWVNNPNNPRFTAPWPRPVYNGPGGLARGSYPYQEVVWGLMQHPHQQRWDAVSLGYPDPSEFCNVAKCVQGTSIAVPGPLHADPCQSRDPVDAAELVSRSPEGPVVAWLGDEIAVTFRVRNIGDTVWSRFDGYALKRTGGDLDGSPATIELADGKEWVGEDELEIAVRVLARGEGPKRVRYRLHQDNEPFGPELEVALNVSTETDRDGDGHPRIAAGGDDCDDNDATVYPGAPERCDGKDNNCDGQIDEGLTRQCSTACGTGVEVCEGGQYSACSAQMPAEESCNGIDDDCNGVVDDGNTCDRDDDGHLHTAAGGDDCDDNDATVYPGAPELCDGKDNNCDGQIDEGLTRQCSTACGAGVEVCEGGQYSACSAQLPAEESCNGIDDDCNGVVDDGELCGRYGLCVQGECIRVPFSTPVPEDSCGCSSAGGAAVGLVPLLVALWRRRS